MAQQTSSNHSHERKQRQEWNEIFLWDQETVTGPEMRFKTYISRAAHTEFATCVGWITPEELVSCGDDHRLIFWNVLTHEPTKKVDLPPDLFPTDIHCFPKSVTSGKQKQVTAELLALGATDGKYHLIARTGRIEKIVGLPYITHS